MIREKEDTWIRIAHGGVSWVLSPKSGSVSSYTNGVSLIRTHGYSARLYGGELPLGESRSPGVRMVRALNLMDTLNQLWDKGWRRRALEKFLEDHKTP